MTTATATEPTTIPAHYQRLLDLARETQLIGGCANMLGWDQEVNMPAGGQCLPGQPTRHARETAPRDEYEFGVRRCSGRVRIRW